MKKAVFPIFVVAAALTACAQPTTSANTHTNTNTRTNREAAMLSEIYATPINDIATQRADVSGIVFRYLPIGTSKAKAQAFLKGLGEGKVDESSGQMIYTTRQGEGFKGNRRDVIVKIQFDSNNNIASITSHIDKSNNL